MCPVLFKNNKGTANKNTDADTMSMLYNIYKEIRCAQCMK